MIQLHVENGRIKLGFAKLSESQASALHADREIAVSAGAGAGKTFTLAARYVTLLQRLVDAGTPDIASVLVLTFTEKAAQEMRERCYALTAAVARALRTDAEQLRAEGLSERAHTRLRAGWEALRDHFSGAAISTFHGFCARILREFPAETSTPPGFTILEESDASALAFESAAREVDARLEADRSGIGLLLHTFGGRAGLVAAVTGLVRARAEVGETLHAHASGRVTEADLLAHAPVTHAAARAFLVDEWAPLTDHLLAVAGELRTPFLTHLAATRAAHRTLPSDPFALYGAYSATLTAFCTSAGSLRSLPHASAMGKRTAWGAGYADAKRAFEAAMEVVTGWAPRLAALGSLPNLHDRTLLSVLAALGELVRAACERHAQGLRTLGAVDFTELQLRVQAAFARPEGDIGTELRSRHRYVMVDEFQDTDGLQWSIVEALTRPADVHAQEGSADRLFFVGDVKQAIYGFRGGDVQVFNAARRSVAHAVSLSTNYRSRASLIRFFNDLFADVLGPDHPDRPAWEAPFAPLAAGRTDPGGSVHLATYAAPGTDPEREATWIATLLQEEILSDEGCFAGLGLSDLACHPTPPIAILLRRRTHLLAYEAALRSRGIPYVVLGGVGFWSRPEIVDIVNVLHGLVRRDPISLVGALRSPAFGLTDQDLLDLARESALVDFADAALPAILLRNSRVTRAQGIWRGLAQLRDHVSVSELLHAVLVRTRQAWLQGYAAPGGRGANNLERLLAMADRHEQSGGTLDAFAAMLHARIDADTADAEAAVPDTAARVAILTVHASKGLEYPVVVVPDLGGPWNGGGDRGAVIRRRVGSRWELACKVPDLQGPVDDLAEPGLLGRLREHGAAVEAAEARRLFYVACTRARDHLVLVGARKPNPPDSPRSWADLLQAHDAVRTEVPPWLFRVDLDEALPAGPASPPRSPPLLPPPTDAAARVARLGAEPRIGVPPSSLALFATDPDQWVRRHVLRIPLLGLRLEDAQAADARIAGVSGEVLHGLLEDNLLDDECVARARWEAAAYGAGLDPARVEEGWPTVARQLATLRESPDVASVLAASGYAELGVRLVQGAVTLDGRIDRLCHDPVDGAWMVVDYKSVRSVADPIAVLAEFRSQLLAYSAAASHVLTAHGEGRVRRAAILFTRTGRLVRLPDWTDSDFDAITATFGAVAARVRVEGIPLP